MQIMMIAFGDTVLIRVWCILFFFLLISCGSDDPIFIDDQASGLNPGMPDPSPILPCSKSSTRLTMEVIIGDLDWSDYLDLKNAREVLNAKTTGQIRIPAIGASCTAFLINENSIMTNNHCVPNDFHARGVRFLIRDDNELRETFLCENLLATNAVLDFSILECDRDPGLKYGYLALSLSLSALNQEMYLIQENCDYTSDPRCTIHKYISRGAIRRLGLNSISHDADTLGGSSGSPIFHSQTHELIGIHHAGMAASGSSHAMNFGIPMHRIAGYLNNNHPEISIGHSDDSRGDCP
jgi:hypothetical protein